MAARLAKYKGGVVLLGEDITRLAGLDNPDTYSEPAHVVLITAEEALQLGDQLNNQLRSVTAIRLPVGLGYGRQNKNGFKVLFWAQGDAVRRRLKLPQKQFYVFSSGRSTGDGAGSIINPAISKISEIASLSSDEIRTIISDCRRLTSPKQWRTSCNEVALVLAEKHFKELTNDTFNELWSLLKHIGMNQTASQLALTYHTEFPTSIAGHLRMGDSLQRSKEAKRAMYHYAYTAQHAISSSGGDDTNDTKKNEICAVAMNAILRCWQYTEFGGVFRDRELDQWENYRDFFHDNDYLFWCLGSAKLRCIIQEAFANYIHEGLLDMDTFLPRLPSLPSNQRLSVLREREMYKLPRFFRWLVPFRLAIMSTPRSADDIHVLETTLGIETIVTLTEEVPLPIKWFAQGGSRNIHIPVKDGRAPSVEQVNRFIDIMTALPPDGAALIHCGGGKGRAGTFAACYLMACGFGSRSVRKGGFEDPDDRPLYAAEAMRLIRHIRPGSIETDEQEQFVRRFGSLLQKPPDAKLDLSEDLQVDTPLEIKGKLVPETKLVVCCGVPGSGKSTFAGHLAGSLGFDVICQDELGTYDACLSALANSIQCEKRIVVDVRNPTSERRHSWIANAFLPNDALCVWFDFDVETCVKRANARSDHPTIAEGKARKIVKSAAKEFVAPTEKEKFACIARVRSTRAAADLLEMLGVPSAKMECYVPVQHEEQELATPIIAASATTTRPSLAPEITKPFVSFPRTRHLFNLGAATSDDVVEEENDSASFLSTSTPSIKLTLEEKVDGANMGIQLDPSSPTGFRVQSRSRFLPDHPTDQFKKVNKWVFDHEEGLKKLLSGGGDDKAGVEPGRYILYGEWMFAKHAILYQGLSDTFLAFDLYDTKLDFFFSRQALATKMERTGISQVPAVSLPAQVEGRSGLHLEVLQDLVCTLHSAYGDVFAEGIYLRREDGDRLIDRAKIVRKDFKAGNDKWVRSGTKGMALNKVAGG